MRQSGKLPSLACSGTGERLWLGFPVVLMALLVLEAVAALVLAWSAGILMWLAVSILDLLVAAKLFYLVPVLSVPLGLTLW